LIEVVYALFPVLEADLELAVTRSTEEEQPKREREQETLLSENLHRKARYTDAKSRLKYTRLPPTA
jgi:hypothetical protein